MGHKRARDVVVDVVQRHPAPQVDRKNAQLERAIARSLQRTLDVEVDDPALDGVSLVDVRRGAGGLFVAVFSGSAGCVDEQQRRLEGALGVFRTALAQDLTRKRVPTVQVVVVPAAAVAGTEAA